MAQAKPARTLQVRRLIILLIIVVLLSLLIARVFSITVLWNTILLKPMLNFLILMSRYFLGSFGIAIIVLTLLIRLLMLPLSMRMLQSGKTGQLIRPQVEELQKKYAKDKEKLSLEIAKLYKESGYNPLGCAFPMLIQLPFWIALYQSVVQALAYTPENLLGLGKQLYSFTVLQDTLPINSHFLWLDLTRGDIVMVFLVGATFWLLQNMYFLPVANRRQGIMNRILPWIMTLLFAFLAFTLPSGLSLYWVVSNIVGMILQYRVTGWGTLKVPSLAFLKRGTAQPSGNPTAKTAGAAAAGKRAVKSVGPQQSATKKAAGSDENPRENKVGDGKLGGKGKDAR